MTPKGDHERDPDPGAAHEEPRQDPLDPEVLKPPRAGHAPAEATVPQPTSPHAEGLTEEEREGLVPDLLARRFTSDPRSYWQIVWDDFRRNRLAYAALWLMLAMALIGIFAPLLANHRPYVLDAPAEAAATAPAGAVEPGWQFPLFAALDLADWVLIFGLLQAVTAFVLYRRAASKERPVSTPGAIAMTTIGLLPLALAVIFSPNLRRWIADDPTLAIVPGFLGAPAWAWVLFGGTGLVGAAFFARAVATLFGSQRDALGNLRLGGPLFASAVGAVLVLVFAAWLGTLGQREQDVTDYQALARREGVFAIFPPVPHDYLASEAYMRNQAPLGPYVVVQPSAGSLAAADLGLSDTRREAILALENTAAASPENPVPLTLETPLADLRGGAGVRTHDARAMTDFSIITRSLKRINVALAGTTTIGDVIERINEAADGAVEARLDPAGARLLLEDRTEPRPTYLLGTDASGADLASRIIHATRVALSIGFVSTGIALAIGITIGALMGFFGGWVDIVGMRIIEIFMAIPRLFLLLTIIAFIPPEWNEHMLYAMMAVIGATSWMGAARFIRAEFFKLRNQDFVQAATACGLPVRSVLFKHMLPNGVTPVLVDASFGVAAAIFVETGLSYLGFGIKPPNPSWGKMLSEAVDPSTGVFYWWMAVFPGIMIFVTVFAFNLIGDALRDAIDPKLKKAV